MRRAVVVVALGLAACAGCGGDDAPEDRSDVPVVNRTGGAVTTSERATAGEGERGLVVEISVGRTDPTEERIPPLDGIVATKAGGELECEGRTHGVGSNWGNSSNSSYTFLCPPLSPDAVTEFEVHAL